VDVDVEAQVEMGPEEVGGEVDATSRNTSKKGEGDRG